ncbi:AAA family ATPase [Methylobacterium sp. C25]|uniref:AAA family ATPase n=1 Tax=Methylobacterium sp. C25 TaxID=2721622 RepID=UPI001F243B05|nr:Wzz/FepE/Etk N-terminal domain-containing protein [Methylobacterium sp. C25]MCE4225040.1 AAA family ATPase [Methylobacterium sp. C25]
MLNSVTETIPWKAETAREPDTLRPMLKSIGGMLRRQAVLMMLTAVCGLGIGFAYTRNVQPTFSAEVSLLVEARKVQIFNNASVYDEAPLDGSGIETQIGIIRSDKNLAAVIDKLHLLDVPEFTKPPESAFARLRNFVAALFATDEKEGKDAVAPSSDALMAQAIEALKARLEVWRVGGSYVVAVRFRASDPLRAANVANGIASAYIDGQRDIRSAGTLAASTWMQERLAELHLQSLAADQAVIDFKSKNKIVTAQGHLLNDQELGALNAEVAAARERSTEARARLDRINAVIKANQVDPRSAATVSDVANSPGMAKLRSEFIELSARIADWSARYGAKHQAVENLQRKLQVINSAIASETKSIAETYKSNLEIAMERQRSVEKRLDDAITTTRTTNQAQSVLRNLESSAQTYSSLSNNLAQRYTELLQQQSFPAGIATIMARATVPTATNQTKANLVLAGTTLAGLLLGAGLGFLRETFDNVFRTSDQINDVLQSECLAMVPLLRTSGRNERRHGGATPLPCSERTILRSNDVIWNVVDAPHSHFADAFLLLKSTLAPRVGRSSRIIGITSTLPDEGKSSTAASLAILMAHVGARVVLVDCDLNNPCLSQQLAPSAPGGILEAASEHEKVRELIWHEPLTRLDFLPGCIGPTPAHSSEFFSAPGTVTLFEKLLSEYDYVIADLPPMVPLVDVRTSFRFIEGFILVVEWGRTKRELVEKSLKSAKNVQENLLGVVLSKVNMGRYKSYESNYKTMYASRYISHYRQKDHFVS